MFIIFVLIMPRPTNNRVIQKPPKVKGFKPIGYFGSLTQSVKLNVEEYEVIRLLDYESLTQEEAAKHLRVSRPTLTRIYEKARKKVAVALMEANQLLIEGGSFIFKDEWFECSNCRSKFNNPGDKEIQHCPLCKHQTIVKLSTK